MTERLILPVSDNKEKHETYRNRIAKYNQAMKYEFYCEAIMIAYAMMEDRLRSMLYHMGFLANRSATTIWKKTKPFLQNVVEEYKNERESKSLGINSLSSKMKLIRCIYLWAENIEGGYESSEFAKVLKTQIEGTDISEVLHILEDIEKWKGYRNEIVHSMLNKNIDSLEIVLEPHAIDGMRYTRALDAQERLLKKGNRIRRKMNLPMD